MKVQRILHEAGTALLALLMGTAAVTMLVGIVAIGVLLADAVRGQSWYAPATPATATPTTGPTSTSTAAPTPTSTPTPEPAVYRVTWYGAAFQGGPVACGTDIYGAFDLDDPTTAASGEGGPPCGTRLRLCSDVACQTVTIKDACGGCGPGHLDLSRAAWEMLGRPTHVEAQLLQAVNPPALLEPPIPPEPVTALTGGDFALLPLPSGVAVRYDGCGPTWGCSLWYNYYDAAGLAIVLQPGEPHHKEVHEWCHAHQHWAINGGAPLAPSDYDLESWYSTAEGQGFTAAVAGLGWPWTHSAASGLEDFAWTCAYWYADPQRLLDAGGQARYDWARANLP